MSEEKDYIKLLEEAAQKKHLSLQNAAIVDLAVSISASNSASLYILEALISSGNITEESKNNALTDLKKSAEQCNKIIKMAEKYLNGGDKRVIFLNFLI